jgi:stress response protein YsnF
MAPIVPVYEEQLVLVKQLVLKEHLRIERVRITERRQFQDTVQRERVVVDDADKPGVVREEWPSPSERPAVASAPQPPAGARQDAR